ncbi:hypothetical protein [Microbacterium yannicii]|uniref:hypothetical protein n=1 Tax=Microbacterium yannicii TaxID=671622 RepID=UPI0003056DAA|nr:hypothetical protein [Microbacterium yannicii]
MQREREARRAYRERNADRIREWKRAWRERNAEHVREYRAAYDAEHRDEVLAQKRAYMKGYAARQAAERARAQAKRASSKKYYEANKEKHHRYERAWRARKLAEDPEGYRARRAAYQRRRRERTKEADNARLRARRRENPEAGRAAQREYYARNAEKLKAQKRAHYETHREEVLARNRAWKEREKRRREAGLPPRRLHTTSATQREVNTAAADAFFTRSRTREEIAELRKNPGLDASVERTPDELVAAFERASRRARIEHLLATDASFADRHRVAEARRWQASQESFRRAQRQAAEAARLDEIGRQVNDRLRHKEPPRRRHHLDPAAPHPMLNSNTTMGMNR